MDGDTEGDFRHAGFAAWVRLKGEQVTTLHHSFSFSKKDSVDPS